MVDATTIAIAVVLVLVVGIAVAYVLRGTSSPFRLEETPRSSPEGGAPSESPPEDLGEPELESPEAVPEAPPGRPTIFEQFRSALGRSRSTLEEGIARLLGRPTDDAAMQDLEEALIQADVGVLTAQSLVETVRAAARQSSDGEALRTALRDRMSEMLRQVHAPLAQTSAPPLVILVVGVNGSGKTTTIGKLAHRFRAEGKRVMLAAADTFRAAASEQLQVWAERTGADFTSLGEGADPGAVAYQAAEKALANGHDVIIVDTAGRLQTRKPLMEQLSKIRRVIQKQLPEAPHETLLVVDGTMGQNAMSQATLFHEATPLTGVVVTKLDGTAKGGMVLAIASELKLPVKLVGLGEQAEDLREFDPDAFVEALV